MSTDRRPWVAHYQPGVPAEIELPTESLVAMFERSVAEAGSSPATEFFGRRPTYAELGDQVDRVAEGLHRLGVRPGARVALIARGEDGLRGAADAVEYAGGVALPLPVDVADFEAVDRAAQRVETELGPIDIWVNVAFTSVFAPFTKISPAEFRRVTDVAYLGYVHGTMAALRRMVPRDRGTIVQVGSALSYRAIPLQSAYCGAKHAINGFTESVRTELLHDHSNVHVTVVQMPAVNTPQFSWVLSRLPRNPQPVPPIYQPEVAARGVLLAADHPQRDPVAGADVVLGDRRGGADGEVHAARRAVDTLGDTVVGERVDDEQHAGVLLGPGRHDVELPGAQRHPPVDPAQPVAREERPDAGELGAAADTP